MEGPTAHGMRVEAIDPASTPAHAGSSWVATVARAHEATVTASTTAVVELVRPVVRESWQRCSAVGVDPGLASAPAALSGTSLEEARAAHPLSASLGLIRSLLTDVAEASGCVVAVGDADGRLLWVEGDKSLAGKAENMGFAPGADWSEHTVGTNAPGTALALDALVQIHATEHFLGAVQPWSCTAMPVHDPRTGTMLGVVDLTGTEAAVGPQALGLVRATVAAVQSSLTERISAPTADTAWALNVLGRDCAEFRIGARTHRLSMRHSELMLLLALHPEGLSADAIAVMLHDDDVPAVTIRAELARLRRLLGSDVLLSRPYRLAQLVQVDAVAIRDVLDRGDIATALRSFAGIPMPRSESPAVAELREQVRWHVRRSAMASGDISALTAYTRSDEGRNDVEALALLLRALPPDSPQRPGVTTQLHLAEQACR